jgi:DNA segregation ATPase FtsK/SpoIIIE-like protein
MSMIGDRDEAAEKASKRQAAMAYQQELQAQIADKEQNARASLRPRAAPQQSAEPEVSDADIKAGEMAKRKQAQVAYRAELDAQNSQRPAAPVQQQTRRPVRTDPCAAFSSPMPAHFWLCLTLFSPISKMLKPYSSRKTLKYPHPCSPIAPFRKWQLNF